MTMLPKLVRDKIPNLIRESGKDSKGHIADFSEYSIRIIDKMKEELAEFQESPCLDEAADLYEVFISMLKNWNMKLTDVENTAKIKGEIRGGFAQGIVLDKVFDIPMER